MTHMHARVRYTLVPLVLVAGVSLWGCSGNPGATSVESAPPLAVETATVAPASLADTFDVGGVVQARTTATLASRILAPVRDVRVAPGDRVRAGQVLIVLDGADLEAQARSASAAAAAADQDVVAYAADQASAEAALTLARTTHARVEGLHSRRSATPNELDEATAALHRAEANAAATRARARAARAGLDRARASADAAATTRSFSTITAPFAGVIVEKLVDPGNMAAPGTPLLRLEDTRAFRLEVTVDESRTPHIAPGGRVQVQLDPSQPGNSSDVAGVVDEIALAVSADTRAFLVKIALPPVEGLRSGRYGRARFTGPAKQRLILPEGALIRRGQMTSVFVVDGDRARLRLVNVSGREVLAGLTSGEVVILNPSPDLVDGRRVTAGGTR